MPQSSGNVVPGATTMPAAQQDAASGLSLVIGKSDIWISHFRDSGNPADIKLLDPRFRWNDVYLNSIAAK
jgi:hypothetical protein